MPNGYFALPQPEIRNALLDFAPINNALSGIRQQANADREYGLQRETMDMRRQEFASGQKRQAEQDRIAKIKRGGEMANAIQNMPDNDPAKPQAWQSYLKEFGDGNHSPEEMDFRTGPKIAAAMAGQYLDPIERQTKQLKLQAAQNDVGMYDLDRRFKEAQIKGLEQKDVLNEAIAGMLRGPSTVAPQSPIQPQSFNGQAPDANLIMTADGQASSGGVVAQPEMIDTPMGPMTKDRARQLGMALALAGKGDAGKMLVDESGGMAKPTINQIEERTLNAATQLGRLGEIERSFDPKFLDIGNRMKMLGASWTAKTGGKLSPEIQRDLANYSRFRSAAVNNLNTILKEVSGAAVTPQEYERIQNDQPVAGTGIFDGDDPVSFQSKMKRTSAALKSAIARLNFMRSRGLNFTRETLDQFMSLDDVPGAIDRRGAEIEQQLRQANPQADPMNIQKSVRQQLKREFGI